MLNIAALKNIIISATAGGQYPAIWGSFTNAINGYVSANARVNGFYVGTIPGTPPVPSGFTGPVQYMTVLAMPAPAVLVAMQAASSVPCTNGLKIAQTGLIPILQTSLIVVPLSIPGTVTMTAPIVFAMTPGNFNVDMREMNRDQIMYQIAKYLVERITTSVLVPPTVPAIGTDASAGTVTGLIIQ